MEQDEKSTVQSDENNSKIESAENTSGKKKHKKLSGFDKALIGISSTIGVLMVSSAGVLLLNQRATALYGIPVPVYYDYDAPPKVFAYNKTYTDYAGANKCASDVRALLARIKAHNSNIDERTYYGSIQASSGNDFGATNGISVIPTVSVANGVSIRNTPSETVLSEDTILDTKYYYIAVTEYNQLGAVSKVTVWQQASYFQN